MSVIYYPLVICQGDIGQADIRKIFMQALIYSLHMTHNTSLFSWADNTGALLACIFLLGLRSLESIFSRLLNHIWVLKHILYTFPPFCTALQIYHSFMAQSL